MRASSTTTTEENSWVYVIRSFTNRSLSLSGTIMSKNKELIEVTTQYRINQGLGRRTLTADGLERYAFTLVSGTDFSLTTTDDITLYIYFDNTLWRTITIDYDTSEKTRTWTMPETVDEKIILLGIIAITMIAGLIFRSQTIGKWTFITAGIFSGAITTALLWLSFICGAYVIFGIIKGVIKE